MQAQPATGTPPFGSFAGGPDVINLSNLNVHWTFPIIDKAGRGLPFRYALNFDNSVWMVGNDGDGHNVWQPVNGTLGWIRQTEGMTGYVTYTSGVAYGQGGQVCGNAYADWAYHDPMGTVHYLGQLGAVTSWGCPYLHELTVPFNDGSGYVMYINGSPSATVHLPSGGSVSPPLLNPTGGALIKDANGNFNITGDGRGFSDTTNAVVLTIADNGGGVAYPTYFTYQAPGGNKTITVSYYGYYVQTNFGCSGIAESGATNPPFFPLLTSITYPDGSSYQITYEDTPGTTDHNHKTGGFLRSPCPLGEPSVTPIGADQGTRAFTAMEPRRTSRV